MKRTYYLYAAFILMLILSACSTKKDSVNDEYVPVSQLVVSDDFDWNTIQKVSIDIEAYNNANQPIENLYFQVYDKNPNMEGANLLYRGLTDTQGKFETAINLPTRLRTIWIAGYMQALEFSTQTGAIHYTFGGSSTRTKGGDYAAPISTKGYAFIPGMTFNSLGVPSPMTTDIIPTGLISQINNVFHESQNLPTAHPEFFLTNAMHFLKVDEPANVKITFLSEDASYKNVVGYYVVDQNAVINTVADLGTLTVVFPNASLNNSGGGMFTGDMVDLGTIPGGKLVGYFLLSNAWVSGSTFNSGYYQFYSHNNLNPETTPTFKKHPVEVFSAQYQKMIIAMEDLNRDPGMGADHDFNDVVFALTATPWSSIDLTNVPPLDPGTDSDGDGVINDLDDYPTDFDRAFDNYTPGENVWGSLAFEDQWPAFGDYDFNDLVINYNINQVTNSQNKVKDIKSKFRLTAIGASYHNGFAFELPFGADKINLGSVTSNLGLHSVETGGSKAVVKVFNNAFDVIPQVAGQFINTVAGQTYHQPVLITLNLSLNTPQRPSDFNYLPPYNPFIFRTQTRGLEIHLPDYTPTYLMNTSYFNTVNDNSVPTSGRYYKSQSNLPWALNIASEFNHPVENVQITRAYPKFKHWAQSSGSSYPDWYLNLPGYRNAEYIYQTP